MSIRINKAIKEFGVGLQTIADFTKQKGCPIDDENSLNQKLDDKQYNLLKNEYGLTKTCATRRRKCDRTDRIKSMHILPRDSKKTGTGDDKNCGARRYAPKHRGKRKN